MSDFLDSMMSSSFLRAEALKAGAGEKGLRSMVASARPARPLILDANSFDLIAEAKLASPAEGDLADAGEVVDLAVSMAEAGAAGLSILTEPTAFKGDVKHLESVAAITQVPVMRKDFLVDPIQVLEARAAGASGVLLIARGLDRTRLVEMTDLALDLGMFVLVEIFEEGDLDSASSVFDREVLVGVNARDLTTLEVVPEKHAALRPLLPTHLPAVAESGLSTEDDVVSCAALGYRLALVGTSLVSGGDAAAVTAAMVESGRSAAMRSQR